MTALGHQSGPGIRQNEHKVSKSQVPTTSPPHGVMAMQLGLGTNPAAAGPPSTVTPPVAWAEPGSSGEAPQAGSMRKDKKRVTFDFIGAMVFFLSFVLFH